LVGIKEEWDSLKKLNHLLSRKSRKEGNQMDQNLLDHSDIGSAKYHPKPMPPKQSKSDIIMFKLFGANPDRKQDLSTHRSAARKKKSVVGAELENIGKHGEDMGITRRRTFDAWFRSLLTEKSLG
jgi:hypothetical protein